MGRAKAQRSAGTDIRSPRSPWKLSAKSDYLGYPQSEAQLAKKEGGQARRSCRRAARALDLSHLPRPRIGPNDSPASNIYFNYMGQSPSMHRAETHQRRSMSSSPSSRSAARQLSLRSLGDARGQPEPPAWDSAAESFPGSTQGSLSTTEPNTPAAPDVTPTTPSNISDSDTRRFESTHSFDSQASLNSLRDAAQGMPAELTPRGGTWDYDDSDLGTPAHLTPNPSPLKMSESSDLSSPEPKLRSRNMQILSLSYLVGADVSVGPSSARSDDEGRTSRSASSFVFGANEASDEQTSSPAHPERSPGFLSSASGASEHWRNSVPSTSEIQPMESRGEQGNGGGHIAQEEKQEVEAGFMTPEGLEAGPALRGYEELKTSPPLQQPQWSPPSYSPGNSPGYQHRGPRSARSPGAESALRRSLLRRIGRRALRAVHSLSPRLSDAASAGGDSLSSLSGPSSRTPMTSTPEVTPRAAYTVTVDGWPSSAESSPSRASTQGIQESRQPIGSPEKRFNPLPGIARSPSPGPSEEGQTRSSLSTPPGSPTMSPQLSPRRTPGSNRRLIVRLPMVVEERGSSMDHRSSPADAPSSLQSGSRGGYSPPVLSSAVAARLESIAARFEQAEIERKSGKVQIIGPSLPVPFATRSSAATSPEIQPDTPSPQTEPLPRQARAASPESPEASSGESKGGVKTPSKRPAAKRKGLGLEGRESTGAWGMLALEEGGTQYEGQVGRKGMHGLGVISFKDGGSYAGQWGHSAYNGFGIETFPDGSYYVGQLSAGMPHGSGICNYADGFTYTGTWMHGLQHGKGSQETDESGAFFYVGSFHGGLRQGLGVAGFPGGDEFAGELAQDAPHGYGVARFDGKKGTYEGEWRHGQRHGWAVTTLPNGSLWAGQWMLGKACWLAHLRSTVRDDLCNEFEEAMDFCEEAARLARASSLAALSQAKEIREPGGPVQAAVAEASEEAHLAARDAHIVRQKTQLLCSRSRIA